MRILLHRTLAGSALALGCSLAWAGNSTATLTADNEFWLYTGNGTASNLQFVGEGHSWTSPFTFNFDVAAGDFLYVLANDAGPPKSWQGVFTTPAGPLFSNAADWLGSAVTGGSHVVTQALVAGATWSAPSLSTYGWGNIVGNTNAKWIWMGDDFGGPQTTLYLSAAPVMAAVPEPDQQALMFCGLGVLAWLARRRPRA